MVKEYYQILNISENASQDEIKSAYKKQALKYHPDRCKEQNAEEMFKKVTKAYEVLSDPAKRSNYDQGFPEDGNPNIDMNDMFSNIFGNFFNFGFNGMGNQQQIRKCPEKVVNIEVSLDDLYSGTTYKSFIFIDSKCSSCDGEGGQYDKCGSCDGKGKQQKVIRAGPMIQNIITDCQPCQGQGKTIKIKCKKCDGKGSTEQNYPLEVRLEKGIMNGSQLMLPDQGNYKKGFLRGDLILVIKELKHKYFQRNGHDLIHETSISLLEALTGFEFKVPFFNNKMLNIKSKEIIDTQHSTVVENFGMPINNTNRYGNLIIKYNIVFPSTLSEKRISLLHEALPSNVKHEKFEDTSSELINITVKKN